MYMIDIDTKQKKQVYNLTNSWNVNNDGTRGAKYIEAMYII